MWLISTLLIGFVVGLIARFVKPGNDDAGFIVTTLTGIAGAFIGGAIGRGLNLYEPGQPAGWIMSVVGAVLVLLVASQFNKKSTSSL